MDGAGVEVDEGQPFPGQHVGQSGFLQNEVAVAAVPRPLGHHHRGRAEGQKGLGRRPHHQRMGVDVSGPGVGFDEVGLQKHPLAGHLPIGHAQLRQPLAHDGAEVGVVAGGLGHENGRPGAGVAGAAQTAGDGRDSGRGQELDRLATGQQSATMRRVRSVHVASRPSGP